MGDVIIVFPKIEDGKNIKSMLVRSGIDVAAVCTSGAQALEYLNNLDGGIVICSYRFSDMMYTDLAECLPSSFEMLLIASAGHWSSTEGSNIMRIRMPLKLHDLVNTIQMMFEAQYRARKKRKIEPRVRNEEDQKVINEAKCLLIERNNMTESEAHHYIQKCSMDSGTALAETAQMVICLYR